MIGQQPRTDALFYYFRLEDQIPEDHLLRLVDRHVDLSFVRERLEKRLARVLLLVALLMVFSPPHCQLLLRITG
jgi:hypothetical protein